jgi:glutaredoxin
VLRWFVKQRNLQSQGTVASNRWPPLTENGSSMSKILVQIYSKPGCHLCDEAKAAMQASGCSDQFTLEEVNIEEDAALYEQYRYDIPVIFINGAKAFKHRIDSKEFRRRIERAKR